MNIIPQRQVTASKEAGGTPSSSPSTRRNSTFPTPCALALSRATSTISGAMSVASTKPLGPTILAAGNAGSPVPQATSEDPLAGRDLRELEQHFRHGGAN